MDSFAVFALMSAAVSLVFVSQALFRMTRFTPGAIFVLLGAGLSVAGSRIPGIMGNIVSLSAPVMLGAVLFGCGLRMNIKSSSGSLRPFLLGVSCFLFTAGPLAGISLLFLGMELGEALLVGALGAGVCSFFLSEVVKSLNVKRETSDMLAVGGSLAEALAVVSVLAIITNAQGTSSVVEVVAMGLVFGLLAGVLWVRLARLASGFAYVDAMTVSFALALAAFCEMVFQNGGIISAFFLGLVLGNAGLLKSRFSSESVSAFTGHVLLAGGTFFFFYLGLSSSGMGGTDILLGLAVGAAAYALRVAVAYAALRGDGEGLALAGVSPGGVSVVLLALLASGLPSGGFLLAFSFSLIILSGIASGIASLLVGGKQRRELEAVTYVEKSVSGNIRHAYDISEMKKSIGNE